MAGAVLGAVMIAGSGLLVGFGCGPVVRRLPEPGLEASSHHADRGAGTEDASIRASIQAEFAAKPAYRSLATTGFSLITATVSAASAAIAVITQSPMTWPLWFVFGTVAVVLAAIDAVTTWLPSAIVYPGWLAMVAALLAAGAASAADGSPVLAMVIRVLGCAGVAGGFFLLLWIVTRGRGVAFGDVRLMPLVGAVAGAISWPALYWSLLLGSLVGAVMAAVCWIAGRRDGLPYAPALVSGPYAAALLLSVLD